MHIKYSKVVITEKSNLVICLHLIKEVTDIKLLRIGFYKDRGRERKDKLVSRQDLSLCLDLRDLQTTKLSFKSV